VVITSLEALCYRVMPKSALSDALEYLEEGEEVDREDLVKTLEMNGYQHSSMVEERGDYSIRGWGHRSLFPPVFAAGAPGVLGRPAGVHPPVRSR
jgi:transcription-repair coupling factor (superfamily II helicase)